MQGFLDALGDRTPTPGGGAAAGVVGGVAAALGAMSASFSDKKPALEGQSDLAQRVAGRLRTSAALLYRLGEEDAQAFAELGELMRRPKDDPDRLARWAGAVESALTPPRAMLAACCEVLRTLDDFAPRCNPRLASDLAIAGVLAGAGARAAWWNIKVNLPLVADEAQRRAIASEADRLVARAASLARRVEAAAAAPGSVAIERVPKENR
ncbi:MAG: cyclodeaminase/cyclohydrolase family protein [Planctomycetota bacterium]